MNYILMSVSILFAVLNGALLHRFANRGLNNTGDLFLFNGGMSAVWCVLLLALSLVTGTLRFDGATLLFGGIYGVLLCLFQLFKTMSFASGPVAPTTLISACAFLITTAYTVCFEDDTVTLGQGIGIVLLLMALALCIDLRKGGSDGRTKLTVRWLVWCLLLFFAGGGVGILYRLFGRSAAADNMNSMMLSAAMFSAIVFVALGCAINGARKQPRPQLPRTALIYVVANGITSCIYIRMNLSLANVIPGTVFFPVSNGAMVMLSAVIGWMFFGERLNSRQLVGLLLGTVAIAMIGIL